MNLPATQPTGGPVLIERVSDLRAYLGAARGRGHTVGFVPTMGAFHEGHRSLMRAARANHATVVVSLFVNPLQFGPAEDLDRYPKDLDGDLAAAAAEGVDVVFAPPVEEMYPGFPSPPLTTVSVSGLTDGLCGSARAGHFDGVATVVTKLFSIVGPSTAYFGRKDAQQLAVIGRLVADLDLPVDVVACETIRDADGLALSSRNAYLSAEDRARALALPRALRALTQGIKLEDARKMLDGVEVDYLEIVDSATFQPSSDGDLACGAIRVGTTRLIDNVSLR